MRAIRKIAFFWKACHQKASLYIFVLTLQNSIKPSAASRAGLNGTETYRAIDVCVSMLWGHKETLARTPMLLFPLGEAKRKCWFYQSVGAKNSSDLMWHFYQTSVYVREIACVLEFSVQNWVALGPDGHVDVRGWVIFWNDERERKRMRKTARIMWTELHWQMLLFTINSISNKQLCP